MSIEFLLAPVTADSEGELIKRIKESVGNDMLKPALVIVPPQATYAAEQMLMDTLNKNGLMGVEVLTVTRVAQRILDEVRGMKGRTLSPAGKSMIVKDVLDKNAGELNLIGALAGHADLPLMLSSVITELKGLNVTPEDLLGLSETHKDPSARQKFHDLSVIYGGYLKAVNSNNPPFIDTEDKLEFATQTIRRARQENDPALFLTDTDVFIYGFDVFNARVTDFLTEVMLTAPNTVMSFYHAETGSPDEAVYSMAYKNRLPFQKVLGGTGVKVTKVYTDADKPREIIRLARHLFSLDMPDKIQSGCVSLSKADNMRTEVDGVCAQIAALKQQGTEYGDMAVICGNPQEYLPLIKSRFAKANIPCFIGEKRGILENNLADFVLGAFKISRGRPRKNALAAHALTGYTALDDYNSRRLENYIYEKIKNGSAILKKDFIDAHEEYRCFVQPITELRECAKAAKNGAGWIDCVLEYIDKLNVVDKVSKNASTMRKDGQLQEADYLEQSYLKIMASLLEARELCEDKPADDIIIQILKAGLSAQQISCIPQGSDEVLCAGYSSAWLPGVKVLFALGANQGVMPNYEESGGLLSEAERQAIINGVDADVNEDITVRQKFALTKAFSRPAEKLIISYVDNGELQPSSVADRLPELFSDIETFDLKGVAPALLQNAWELSAKRLRDAADGALIGDEGLKYEAAVLNNPAFKDKYLNLVKSLSSGGGTRLNINGAAAKKLYENRRISPSSVETYYKCPYQHFMKHGIKAYKSKEAGVNFMNMGTYAHAIFNDIFNVAKAEKKTWRDYNDAEFEAIVDGCIAQNKQNMPFYEPNTHESSMLDSIGAEVKEAAKAVYTQYRLKGHNLQQHMSEAEFDANGVHGIIDRVDTAKIDGKDYFGIVDIKTGDKDFKLYKAAAGLDLQMLIYALAAYDLLKDEGDYTLAGINYLLIKRSTAERRENETLEDCYKRIAVQNIKNYRMKGVITVEPDDAQKLYGSTAEDGAFAGSKSNGLYSSSLNISKSGEYDKVQNNRYLLSREDNDEIGDVLRFVKLLLSEADENINCGDIKKLPVSENAGECACKYCDYKSVCRYDPVTVEDVRKVEALSKDAVLEQIRKRLGP